MKHEQCVKICQLYQLGELISLPELVHRGLLNSLWKIKTRKGYFAIKEINPHQGRSTKDYVLSEKIAKEMAKHEIPAIPALDIHGESLQIIDGSTVLVFNWITGKTLSLEPASPQQAKIIGNIFAKMHLINLQFPELTESADHYIGQEKWYQLSSMATEKKLSFAEKLNTNINRLITWESLYQASKVKLGQYELASHRDLNPYNIIWINDTTPKIIDWEWAGLVNPNMEALSAALEWSGLLIGQFNEFSFRAFLQGYYEAGAKITVDPLDALHNSLGKWLDWLAFNIECVCQDTKQADIQLVILEVVKTFKLLECMMGRISEIINITQEIQKIYYLQT